MARAHYARRHIWITHDIHKDERVLWNDLLEIVKKKLFGSSLTTSMLLLILEF